MSGGPLAPVLIIVAVAAAATPCAAQQPSADTTRPTLVFSDVFGGRGSPPGFVILAEGVAYRIEVEPTAAAVNIRQYRLPGQPALVLGAAYSSGTTGTSYIVVPSASAEYQIDAAATGDEPVRVRIFRDPQEQALLEGRAHSRIGALSIGVRSVHLLGDLELPGGTVGSASGGELCLGIVPGLAPITRRLGGCLFTYQRFDLQPDGEMSLIGLAPRYEVVRHGALGVGVALDVGLGGKISYGSSIRVTCQSIGAGVNFRMLTLSRRIEFEVEPGVTALRQDGYTTYPTGGGMRQVPAITNTVARLTAGVHVRL